MLTTTAASPDVKYNDFLKSLKTPIGKISSFAIEFKILGAPANDYKAAPVVEKITPIVTK